MSHYNVAILKWINWMYLIDFPKYSTVFKLYIPKLSKKCTSMNNYQIWRIDMSRKCLSHTAFCKIGVDLYYDVINYLVYK